MQRQRELVIIPALDEAASIRRVIEQISAALPAADVVVIDDGSTDATAKIARDSGASVLRHPFQLGYGAALQTGYRYALAGDYVRVLQIDADGQHDASLAPTLLAPLRSGAADIVLGSRWLAGAASTTGLRQLGSAVLRKLGRFLSGRDFTDPTSGYRAIDRRTLEWLIADSFPDDYPDIDVLIALTLAGVRFEEVPASARPRAAGTSMHRGLRPLYYAYKVALASVLAAWRGRREQTRGH